MASLEREHKEGPGFAPGPLNVEGPDPDEGIALDDLQVPDLPREAEEVFDHRHFYAAYVFDQAHERESDVATLIEQAKQLGYPVRYWWLSEAMRLDGHPDRLIVCVHHPSSGEDAGMDLYDALKEQQVDWDCLEAAALGEYFLFGKAVEGVEAICGADGAALFPPAAGEALV